jgi:hypothetical protein
MGALFPASGYVRCFLTSAACAWLLGRSYRQTSTRLLLWSSICFSFLAANNFVLILDLLVLPEQDLRLLRLLLTLAAILSLIWGFVVDGEEG